MCLSQQLHTKIGFHCFAVWERKSVPRTLDIICLFYAYEKKIENKQTTSKINTYTFYEWISNIDLYTTASCLRIFLCFAAREECDGTKLRS